MNIVTFQIIAPVGMPRNVSGDTIDSTSILIMWNDVNCIERNGKITGYSIHYQPVHYSLLPMLSTTMNRSFTATHLIPHSNYMFQVAAVNVNGTGPNETITLSTEAVKSK